jgi:hypothetical protein
MAGASAEHGTQCSTSSFLVVRALEKGRLYLLLLLVLLITLIV